MEAKIIAGTFSGVTSPGSSHTGMLYYDISLDAGADINIPINDKWNGFCYVYEEEISRGQTVSKSYLAILSTEGVFRCNATKTTLGLF